MKKVSQPDKSHPEHRQEDLSPGVGQRMDSYWEGNKLVLLGPDVAKVFPTEKEVNEALRSLIKLADKSKTLTKTSTGRTKKIAADNSAKKKLPAIANTVAAWRRLLEAMNAAGLDNILADNVVFHSPVVHTPQAGKPITTLYLTAAHHVLNNGTFKYLREVISGNNAILEFSTVIDGIAVNGVDMITWGTDGRITDFKVMIRPLKAVNLVHRMMAELLQKSK